MKKQKQYLGNIFILSQLKIFAKFFNVQMFAVAIKKNAPIIYHL